MNAIATRKVTISQHKANREGGRAYLESFVGLQAVHTDWKGVERVGTVELDMRRGTGYPGEFLLIRFADGTFARADRTLRITK